MKANHRPDIINKIANHPKNSPLFNFFTMRSDISKIWQVQDMTNLFTQLLFCFLQIKPCIFNTKAIYHLTLQFRCQDHCRIQEKFISQFNGHFDGNRGTTNECEINTCIGIYFFNFELCLNVNILWNIPVSNGHIFLRKYYLFAINAYQPKKLFRII